jgi:signal transduction histidine kinase
LGVLDNDQLITAFTPAVCSDAGRVASNELIRHGEERLDEHFVQFYESETYLIDSITNFVCVGIGSGETVLVLATKPHLIALRTRLIEKHLLVDSLENAGRFVPLDAETVQADLTVDGHLSPERFSQFFGSVLSQARDAQRPIRIFGELVAVLWSQGKYSTAIQVEELWNDLQRQMSFTLFCAYPLKGFAGKDLAEPLSQVCLTHSRIVPAESYSSLTNSDEKLRKVADLQQKSISLAHELSEHRKTQDELNAAKVALAIQVAKQEEVSKREQVAREEAEAANRLKNEFLAIVSHELRTPLNAIVGWSHLLNQGRLDAPTSTRAVESIERNAKVQAQMIEDLIDVSRLGAGTLKLSVAKVDLRSVIHAVTDSLRSAAEAKRIELVVDVDTPCDSVMGDSRRLQQIVWHLVDNSIKFTPPDGRVLIQLRQNQAEIEIVVEDSGQGIETEFLESVFEQFRQADSGTTRKHGGLGVGLSIVRHLVELHGGSVSVESEGPAQGTRFVVKLPSAKPTN